MGESMKEFGRSYLVRVWQAGFTHMHFTCGNVEAHKMLTFLSSQTRSAHSLVSSLSVAVS